MTEVIIESSWKEHLKDEFEKPYFKEVIGFLKEEKGNGKILYPPGSLIFNAFNTTPLSKVKLVILGQDPYHNPGEAMGLCFSVNKGVRVPPSLKNVYKELLTDQGIPIPSHGDLTKWAKEGVFLLNAMLTVEKNQPASHRKIGWQLFTDAVIKVISDEQEHVVFLLWGNFAKQKSTLIDSSKHLILTSPHPSPFSANSGFFGCKHFSKANDYLVENGKTAINWEVG